MNTNPKYFVAINEQVSYQDLAVESLREFGFVMIRGLFKETLINNLLADINKALEKPAAGGSFGYSKKDHFRKYVYPPLVIGGDIFETVVNDKVIDIIEVYMDSECSLHEVHIKQDSAQPYVYFMPHLDLFTGYHKSKTSKVVTKEEMKLPLGAGVLVYLHDTDQDVFMYASGTHKWEFNKGGTFTNYSKEERKKILNTMIELPGKAGDVIIFDDRGFHGPKQPTSKTRTVVEIDYKRVKTFGYIQAAPVQINVSDIDKLSRKQLEVLGVKSQLNFDMYEYKIARFNKSKLFPLISKLIDYGFIHEHLRYLIKWVLGTDRIK